MALFLRTIFLLFTSFLKLMAPVTALAQPFSDEGWTIETGNRPIVVVGDIHGDLSALERILQNENLIDETGKWIGRDSVLVLLGDLIDRGPDSLAVMDLMMSLETQAKLAGGHVESILGNHEALVTSGDTRYVSEEEHLSYQAATNTTREAWQNIYWGNSTYAKWIRSRRTIVKLKPSEGPAYIAVHAGLGNWAFDFSPTQINSMVRDWFSYWQGTGPQPDESTEWVVDNNGPLWIRSMSIPEPEPSNARLAEENRIIDMYRQMGLSDLQIADFFPRLAALNHTSLKQVLRHWGAQYVIAGHTTTNYAGSDFRIMKQTSQLGRMLILADTGISSHYDGRLSSLRLSNGQRQVRYHRRPSTPLALTQAFRESCAQRLQKFSN